MQCLSYLVAKSISYSGDTIFDKIFPKIDEQTQALVSQPKIGK